MPQFLEDIQTSDLPDLDKVARAFDRVTQSVIDYARKEVDLARALQDQDAVVKSQIKMATMEHARQIFQDCYRVLLRRSAWDEE